MTKAFFYLGFAPLFLVVAFGLSAPLQSKTQSRPGDIHEHGNILILDHLNMNHEKGRHDWLKAFYFDFLQCGVDPRKAENLESGRKTLWANIGAHQFHLPEGKNDAQVLEGMVTLIYPNLQSLHDRLCQAENDLKGSLFAFEIMADSSILVTDPWGSKFLLTEPKGDADVKDPRGVQSGPASEGLAMKDLTIHVPSGCNLEGIARFYQEVFQDPIQDCTNEECVVSVGPYQSLSFVYAPETSREVSHVELRNDPDFVAPQGFPNYPANFGIHISMYVADLSTTYHRAQELGVIYVNPRFKRRAFTLEEAKKDCMFRILDIVDPENPAGGPILSLEHEVRSAIKVDGGLYKSCPFDEIPEGCKI